MSPYFFRCLCIKEITFGFSIACNKLHVRSVLNPYCNAEPLVIVLFLKNRAEEFMGFVDIRKKLAKNPSEK